MVARPLLPASTAEGLTTDLRLGEIQYACVCPTLMTHITTCTHVDPLPFHPPLPCSGDHDSSHGRKKTVPGTMMGVSSCFGEVSSEQEHASMVARLARDRTCTPPLTHSPLCHLLRAQVAFFTESASTQTAYSRSVCKIMMISHKSFEIFVTAHPRQVGGVRLEEARMG